MLPIAKVASQIGLDPKDLELYGQDKAKISLAALEGKKQSGKLILVSAITPTSAGEGKTTTSIGLAQGLQHLGEKAGLALRQPSMGPVFGRKGGATGGGKSRLEPSDSINLQFTGDFHAITAANNLLSACIDNKLYFNSTRLDPLSVLWKRCLDSNDRALRSIITGLGGRSVGGSPAQTGFDITAASEIMAILCLSSSRSDLRKRLDQILIGYAKDKSPVFAKEIGITGSLMAILNEAIKPNLVQSQEGTPAFVHGGPFANIAHGCNSVLATKMGLTYFDWTVTEAGFAFDLGAEKFFDIKCRSADLNPSVVVLVATVRALKMHGGVPLKGLVATDPRAVEAGLSNLAAHLDGAKHFGKPVVVAINQRIEDAQSELDVIHKFCQQRGVLCSTANVYGQGGLGATDLAKNVMAAAQGPLKPINFLYELSDPIPNKIHAIATKIYGAKDVVFSSLASSKIAKLDADGFGNLGVCIAKTQNSLSDNPKALGRPENFTITVRDIEISSGAGFVVALTGEVLRMPGLPEVPAAESIDVDDQGHILLL
jgi:formate--tetrahydrofolate ligase